MFDCFLKAVLTEQTSNNVRMRSAKFINSSFFYTPSDWTPGLWLNMFEMLLDEELDYGDIWRLNFDYNLTDTLDQAKRRRGWKKFCHSATHGRYELFYSWNVSVLSSCNTHLDFFPRFNIMMALAHDYVIVVAFNNHSILPSLSVPPQKKK